jgi:rhodanese-related sulfurtransferase
MTQTPENETIPLEIDVHAVKQLMDLGAEIFLIDCREQAENEFCRIEGSQLIPMNETPSRLSEIEACRDKRIVVYCHHGARSRFVVQWLRGQGVSQVQNMTGGIDVWSQVIDSEIPRY